MRPEPGPAPDAATAPAAPRPGARRNRLWLAQTAFALGLCGLWWALTASEVLPPFFFGQPLQVARRIVGWFASGVVWPHLGVTLLETVLAFAIGTALGLGAGLWLALAPGTAALARPWVAAANAMPRVVLAPIFAVWFGLGVGSKVALGVTLVFFVVFFNVYQGVREVAPALLANVRLLGASRRQLLRHVYLPAATAWVCSSLHAAVGMAFAGAVVGEYLGSASGIGYLILQAEGSFDIDTVYAGIVVLTVCALLLDAAVSAFERRLLQWQPPRGE